MKTGWRASQSTERRRLIRRRRLRSSCSSSGSEMLATEAQQLAHLRDELEEARDPRASRRCAAEARSMSTSPGDPAGPRAHHDDAGREEDGLGDRVRHEDDGRTRAAARSRAARGSGARASSRRARRTARPSGAAPARTRAPVRSRRAAACRPRAATDGGRRSSASSTSSSISSTRALRRATVPAEQLERELRCSSAPCATRRGPRPGRRCRSRGRRVPVGRVLPLIVTLPCVGSMRSPITRRSVDFPHPDGPISDTNSFAASVSSMSCSAVTLPRGKVFVTPSTRTTGSVALTPSPRARGGRSPSRRSRRPRRR